MTKRFSDGALLAIMAIAALVGYLELIDETTVVFGTIIVVAVILGNRVDDAHTEIAVLRRRLEDTQSKVDSMWRDR